MQDEITFEDCCRMILQDWPYRQDSAHEDWRIYFRHRLGLLVQEFGITWTENKWGVPGNGIPFVAGQMLSQYNDITTPMFATLAYTYQPGEYEVHRRHLKHIATVETQLKHLWVTFFRDLLLLRFPEAATRTTSWSRLKSLGLPEEPDTAIT